MDLSIFLFLFIIALCAVVAASRADHQSKENTEKLMRYMKAQEPHHV